MSHKETDRNEYIVWLKDNQKLTFREIAKKLSASGKRISHQRCHEIYMRLKILGG